MGFVYTDKQTVLKIAENIEGSKLSAMLIKQAKECMTEPAVSITDMPCPALSPDIHDYCSEAPYWWQDPKNPTGPYIRRDGEYNPDRFAQHLELLRKMSMQVVLMAMSGFYTQNNDYSENAAMRLRVFFLDEKTRMNPQMEHSQAIRGICSGRGIGIIDAVALHRVINALDFLRLSGRYDDVINGVEKWFSEFLNWLLTSQCGADEKKVGNNHSMWYAALIMAIASMLNEQAIVEEYAEFYRNTLVYQIRPDGGFADELTRTNAFQYTVFNLTAVTIICEIAFHKGIDLWNYKTADGRGIKAAVEFLLPFLAEPESWPYQEIDGKVPDASFALTLCANRIGTKQLKVRDDFDAEEYSMWHPLGPTPLVCINKTSES